MNIYDECLPGNKPDFERPASEDKLGELECKRD